MEPWLEARWESCESGMVRAGLVFGTGWVGSKRSWDRLRFWKWPATVVRGLRSPCRSSSKTAVEVGGCEVRSRVGEGAKAKSAGSSMARSRFLLGEGMRDPGLVGE